MLNSLSARDVKSLLHGAVELSSIKAADMTVITKGKGCYVFDENGTPYIDALGGLWCASLGFGDEEIAEAAYEQMKKVSYYHTIYYKSVEPAVELAEKLSNIAPIKNAHVYLGVSGSEANDTLVKFVWYYNNALGRQRKKKIISRNAAYHGVLLASGSMTGLLPNHLSFDLPLPNFLHLTAPHFYQEGLPGESEAEFVDRLVRELEEMINREGADTIAAFIAEPVMGAGGVIIPPAGYHEKVQKVLKRNDILFLADEVITGHFRTGPCWGSQKMGIQPDTITTAKGLTSGHLPLAALVLSDEIYQGLARGSGGIGYFGHGATYSGHPVSCAVALKVIELMERRNIQAHVDKVSKKFLARIHQFNDHPLVGDTRGVGMMGAIEFVSDKKTKKGFEKRVCDLVVHRALDEYKLMLRPISVIDACAFAPPLVVTESEIDDIFDRFGRALDDVAATIGKS